MQTVVKVSLSNTLLVSVGLLDKPHEVILELVEASDVSYSGDHGDLLTQGAAHSGAWHELVDQDDTLNLVVSIATNVSLANVKVAF